MFSLLVQSNTNQCSREAAKECSPWRKPWALILKWTSPEGAEEYSAAFIREYKHRPCQIRLQCRVPIILSQNSIPPH